MPYWICSGCGLELYSAATNAQLEDCPRCGRELVLQTADAGTASLGTSEEN